MKGRNPVIHRVIQGIDRLMDQYTKGVEFMNQEQFDKVKNGKGFIAALDQSGGSTPKALLAYGVQEDAY